MHALRERTDFVWTLTWLGHACAVGTDGLCVDVNMVGTCMLCGNGRTFVWTFNMVGTCMLCGNGRTLCGHLTWLGHACSVGTRMLEANTGKTTEKRKKKHDKTHQNAAYLRKTQTKTPVMCKKHRRMPGKIRRTHLLFRVIC